MYQFMVVPAVTFDHRGIPNPFVNTTFRRNFGCRPCATAHNAFMGCCGDGFRNWGNGDAPSLKVGVPLGMGEVFEHWRRRDHCCGQPEKTAKIETFVIRPFQSKKTDEWISCAHSSRSGFGEGQTQKGTCVVSLMFPSAGYWCLSFQNEIKVSDN